MIEKQLELGKLYISNDVVSFISAISLNEIDGIASTVSDIREDLIRVITQRGSQRGVNVTNVENEVIIELNISVYYGVKIHEVCLKLQQFIKEQVEMMTGVTVSSVNLTVTQVKFKEQ